MTTATKIRGSNINTTDTNLFVSSSSGAGDSGKIPLLGSDGSLARGFASSVYSFGDGSDGDVTISGGTTTITADMYYNNLTIDGTGILATNGYRIFVKGTLTNDGIIKNNGSNGNAGGDASSGTPGIVGTGGAGAVGGTLKAGGSGANGAAGVKANGAGGGIVSGTGGSSVSATTVGLGSAGGVGGTGGGVPTGGAGGGTVGTVTCTKKPHTLNEWINFFQTQYATDSTFLFYSGSIGGSGAGSGAAQGQNGASQEGDSGGGGGGGGAGGIVYIAAKTIINSGTIQAAGGNGGNGGNGYAQTNSPAKGGGGATGGGGGGGIVILIYQSKTNSGTISCPAGTAGATVGLGYTNGMVATPAYNGGLGSVGTDGIVYNVSVLSY